MKPLRSFLILFISLLTFSHLGSAALQDFPAATIPRRPPGSIYDDLRDRCTLKSRLTPTGVSSFSEYLYFQGYCLRWAIHTIRISGREWDIFPSLALAGITVHAALMPAFDQAIDDFSLYADDLINYDSATSFTYKILNDHLQKLSSHHQRPLGPDLQDESSSMIIQSFDDLIQKGDHLAELHKRAESSLALFWNLLHAVEQDSLSKWSQAYQEQQQQQSLFQWTFSFSFSLSSTGPSLEQPQPFDKTDLADLKEVFNAMYLHMQWTQNQLRHHRASWSEFSLFLRSYRSDARFENLATLTLEQLGRWPPNL